MAEKKAFVLGISPGPTVERVCALCVLPVVVSARVLAEYAERAGGEQHLVIAHAGCHLEHADKLFRAALAEQRRGAEIVRIPVVIDGDPGTPGGTPPRPDN